MHMFAYKFQFHFWNFVWQGRSPFGRVRRLGEQAPNIVDFAHNVPVK